MADPKTTSAAAAARRINRHPQTIRRWCAEKNFGVLVGGRWAIPNANIERIEQALNRANGSEVLHRHTPSTQRSG
jgi:DNA-binding transcriptional regulator PaaX